jgi:hypothetical protein
MRCPAASGRYPGNNVGSLHAAEKPWRVWPFHLRPRVVIRSRKRPPSIPMTNGWPWSSSLPSHAISPRDESPWRPTSRQRQRIGLVWIATPCLESPALDTAIEGHKRAICTTERTHLGLQRPRKPIPSSPKTPPRPLGPRVLFPRFGVALRKEGAETWMVSPCPRHRMPASYRL